MRLSGLEIKGGPTSRGRKSPSWGRSTSMPGRSLGTEQKYHPFVYAGAVGVRWRHCRMEFVSPKKIITLRYSSPSLMVKKM